MAIKTGDYLNTQDIYIDYSFEEVMFRRMKIDGSVYRKFYGESEYPDPIPSSNRLYNEALLSGEEISKEEYETGK